MASTAVGKAIKKWVVICDKLDVVGQVVSKTAGCVLKITYKAGKPVFHVLYEGVKVIPKFFEAPVSGKLYSFIIPLPQVNLKGGIEAFKEAIAKGEVKVERVLDEAGNIIVDEEGNILNKAITKEGEEVELLEKVNIKSNGLLTRLNNASFKVLKGKFDELDDVLKQKFLSDFDDVPDQILYKLQDEDLVDAWRILDDAGVDEILRRNIEALADPDATLDAIQMSQKIKPTWAEIQVLFKRGNDFNRKAAKNDWYPFNEVHLSNGKRLDSYNPVKGEIVSRKATDLNNIQKSTFEGYLQELKNKYPTKTTIRSNKYPQIDGQQLIGKQILEIPESNQSFNKLHEYIDLATIYNVEIRFRPE